MTFKIQNDVASLSLGMGKNFHMSEDGVKYTVYFQNKKISQYVGNRHVPRETNLLQAMYHFNKAIQNKILDDLGYSEEE